LTLVDQVAQFLDLGLERLDLLLVALLAEFKLLFQDCARLRLELFAIGVGLGTAELMRDFVSLVREIDLFVR